MSIPSRRVGGITTLRLRLSQTGWLAVIFVLCLGAAFHRTEAATERARPAVAKSASPGKPPRGQGAEGRAVAVEWRGGGELWTGVRESVSVGRNVWATF